MFREPARIPSNANRIMNENPLKFDQVREALLSALPELKQGIAVTFGSYYDLAHELPDAYPIFEDVVKKRLLELLNTGQDEAMLLRLFRLFEEMANSSDRNVTDLLGIAILEPLIWDSENSLRAWHYMGQKTREFARQEAEIQNKPESVPPG
jgi:hypothetical protein